MADISLMFQAEFQQIAKSLQKMGLEVDPASVELTAEDEKVVLKYRWKIEDDKKKDSDTEQVHWSQSHELKYHDIFGIKI